MSQNFKKFTHTKCEYYPCHKLNEGEELNCKFCFCPLYPLLDCGGNYMLLGKDIKDCSNCMIPHSEDGHDKIVNRLANEPIKLG